MAVGVQAKRVDSFSVSQKACLATVFARGRCGKAEEGSGKKGSEILTVKAECRECCQWEPGFFVALKRTQSSVRTLACTSRQTADRLLHFLITSKIASVGFQQALLDFRDLPFINGHIFLDRLGSDERAAAVHRFRQTVELLLELCIQPESEDRRFRHDEHIVRWLNGKSTLESYR